MRLILSIRHKQGSQATTANKSGKKKKTMPTQKKKIQQGLEERNPGGGGGGGGSTSSTSPPHGPPPPPADRISELPVEILHRILGFLEMDEFLIRTSLVSTKWRNLWKSVSVLKFTRCRANDSGCACVLKYQNFVDHVLRLRDSQASKIQIFRYCCYNINNSRRRRRRRRGGGYDDLERLHKLIVSAVVNQGAQEIQITGASYLCRRSNGNNMKMIHFNPSIFTSGELRKFTFQVFNDHFRIQFPRSMCCSATQLTHLTLSEIRLPEGGDDAQLHLVCPVLEELLISDCYAEHLKVLDVSAPRLNDLAIYNTAGSGSEYLGECRIEIRTPNLTRLFYYGFVYVDCFTENLPYLESANGKP